MITNQELLQIKHYLKSRKLSDNVLNEVLDHFVPQISELMFSEKINFQEAFIKIKILWKYDLEMVKADIFSFKKIARIEKTILQMRFRRIMGISLVISLGIIGLYVLFPDSLLYSMLGLSAILFIYLGYGFLFKNLKFRDLVAFNFHPLIIRNQIFALIIGIGFMVSRTFFEVESITYFLIFSVFGISTQIQMTYYKMKNTTILL
ncbi:hypothetical protein [Chryseobacterium sp.]|uniref:hypothetical protein n=1 Tax=Chryseobacterium sp. TaxID=1871047 RepID=UPI00388E4BB2